MERIKILKFCRYLAPFWPKALLALVLNTLAIGIGLVNPYLAKIIIDQAYAEKNLRLFIILVAGAGFIFALSGILSGVSSYLNRYIKLRINLALNRKVFKKLSLLSYGFFQDTSTGENLYKIGYDIERLSQFSAVILPRLITFIPKTLFLLAVIFYLNWKIGLLALLLMPFLYTFSFYLIKRLRKMSKALLENSQGIFSGLQEVLSHMQLVKAFGKERTAQRNYLHKLIANLRLNLKIVKFETGGSFVHTLVDRAILGLLIFYAGYQLLQGKISLGSLTAISIYLGQLAGLQNTLSYYLQEISLGLVSAERLDDLLQTVPESKTETKSEYAGFSKDSIEFKNVSFSYKPGKTVLENLGFSVPAGAFISLAGASGIGKTTILHLITRLFRPQEGAILINGTDINYIKSQALYAQIGFALQEPFLWNDSIENNISYGARNASLQEIQQAAKTACIEEFINTLPCGWATVIGENACKISEGQKQRIALARAIIKRPKILLLDEALSSLDSETEAKIIGNLRNALRETTLILVSHRLSTVLSMDLAYFLRGADEIIIAKPQELLEKNVSFRNLFAGQIKDVSLSCPTQDMP